MAEPSEISGEEIVRFLKSRGGKITNVELVSHFRKILNDPSNQVNARLKFKDIVNTVASVHEEHGTKYISLKPKYLEWSNHESGDRNSISSCHQYRSLDSNSATRDYQPYWRYRLSSNNKMVPPPPVLSFRSISCEGSALSKSMDEATFYGVNDHGRCRSLSYEESTPFKLVRPPSFEHNVPSTIRNNAEKRRAAVYDDDVALLLDSQNLAGQDTVGHSYIESDYSLDHVHQTHQVHATQDDHEYTINSCTVGLPSFENGDGQVLSSDSSVESNRKNSEFDENVPDRNDLLNSSHLRDATSLRAEQKQMALATCKSEKTEAPPNGTNETNDGYHPRSGSVKEIAQQIDNMASLDFPSRRASPRASYRHRGNEKISDDDSSLVSTLDPKLRRQWFVKAAQCDYHGMSGLLKVEPRLAGIRDVTSGFTALHWAAKHGNADVVKLIAGTYRVNPDVKSHGGYTAVHLATLYKHKDIVDLLLKTYGANPTIRDNSGKRADQYPPDYVCAVAGATRQAASARHIKSITIPLNNKIICVRPADKEPSPSGTFLRIGSLNLKVSMTAPAFGSNRNRRIQRLKTWGSADSVPETSWTPQWTSAINERMSFRRKKKAKKKNNDLSSPSSNSTKVDSDSDSAYGFYS